MFGILVGHVAVLAVLQATPGQPQRLLPVLHKAYFDEQNVLKFVASKETDFLFHGSSFLSITDYGVAESEPEL